MNWQTIDTAPDHGKQILVGFMGQFYWFSYVTNAHGIETGKHSGNAMPTHWVAITNTPEFV